MRAIDDVDLAELSALVEKTLFDKGYLVSVTVADDAARCLAKNINDIIYAKGAPLGSPEYFRIRELCTEALK